MAPLRIAHVCRVAPPSVGGMEAVVSGLARRQAAAGHDVRWVTLQRAPAPVEGVDVVGLQRGGARGVPDVARLMAALRGVDVVHVHGLDPLLVAVLAARPREARVGVSTHGGFLHSRRWAWVKAAVRWTALAAALAAVDAVWLTSEVDRALLVPGQPAVVVPDGADLRALLDGQRRPTPGLWVLPGRIDRHKGHVDALRVVAAARAAGGGPSRLEVVGGANDPALLVALQREAAALGLADVTRWTGAVSLAAWREALWSADLALFPSTYESFGLALVEAMAAGGAPVASPIEAHRAQVRSGQDGLLLDFASPDAAGRLVAFAAADRAAMGASARVRASRWDWAEVMPRWDAAYSSLRSS